jgi:hypothetical protein
MLPLAWTLPSVRIFVDTEHVRGSRHYQHMATIYRAGRQKPMRGISRFSFSVFSFSISLIYSVYFLASSEDANGIADWGKGDKSKFYGTTLSLERSQTHIKRSLGAKRNERKNLHFISILILTVE